MADREKPACAGCEEDIFCDYFQQYGDKLATQRVCINDAQKKARSAKITKINPEERQSVTSGRVTHEGFGNDTREEMLNK